jgi:hypothetical protein
MMHLGQEGDIIQEEIKIFQSQAELPYFYENGGHRQLQKSTDIEQYFGDQRIN